MATLGEDMLEVVWVARAVGGEDVVVVGTGVGAGVGSCEILLSPGPPFIFSVSPLGVGDFAGASPWVSLKLFFCFLLPKHIIQSESLGDGRPEAFR